MPSQGHICLQVEQQCFPLRDMSVFVVRCVWNSSRVRPLELRTLQPSPLLARCKAGCFTDVDLVYHHPHALL